MFAKKLTLVAVLFLLITSISLVFAFADDDNADIVQLSDLQSLPEVPDYEVAPIRVAVAAIISPQGTVESYQPLIDYIGDSLNRPVELVQRNTYAEVNELIQRGEVDIGFICTRAYVIGKDDFGFQLLAAPQVNGEALYYSVLIVPAESSARSIEDLRGAVFAFTDPLSTTGWLYPTYLIHQLGTTPDEFFSRTFFTYSHDKAIESVANGIADAATVDSIVYEHLLRQNPRLAQNLQVIHTSPAIGSPPVVVNPDSRPQFQAELEMLLLNLENTDEGQAILSELGIDRFVHIDDSAYDYIREIMAEIQ